jgi:hypothetical protein
MDYEGGGTRWVNWITDCSQAIAAAHTMSPLSDFCSTPYARRQIKKIALLERNARWASLHERLQTYARKRGQP